MSSFAVFKAAIWG